MILLKTKVDEVSSDNVEKQVSEEEVEDSKDKVGWLYSLEVSVQNEMLVKELVSKVVLAGLPTEPSEDGSWEEDTKMRYFMMRCFLTICAVCP